MIYIDEDDLRTESYQRFIDESTNDFPDVKAKAELKSIGIAKTLLKGRYDVDKIFDENEPVRDEFLAEIITKLTISKIFGRNAARKVPSDVKEDFDFAMKQLRDLNAGRITLDLDLPATSNNGVNIGIMYGNTRNENNYI